MLSVFSAIDWEKVACVAFVDVIDDAKDDEFVVTVDDNEFIWSARDEDVSVNCCCMFKTWVWIEPELFENEPDNRVICKASDADCVVKTPCIDVIEAARDDDVVVVVAAIASARPAKDELFVITVPWTVLIDADWFISELDWTITLPDNFAKDELTVANDDDVVVVIVVNELETLVSRDAEAPAATPRTDSPVASDDDTLTKEADVAVEFTLTEESEEDSAVVAIDVDEDTAEFVAVKEEESVVMTVEVEDDIEVFVTDNEDDRDDSEVLAEDETRLMFDDIVARDWDIDEDRFENDAVIDNIELPMLPREVENEPLIDTNDEEIPEE